MSLLQSLKHLLSDKLELLEVNLVLFVSVEELDWDPLIELLVELPLPWNQLRSVFDHLGLVAD